MTLRFGTDGVRGVAGAELTPELVVALGRAAADVLCPRGGERASFVVGRDTRWSGSLLQAALSAGLAGAGADVIDVGVLPTPGVAALSAEWNLPAAVISASHNPYPDNGIKLFAAGGRKLSDSLEAAVEAGLARLVGSAGPGPSEVAAMQGLAGTGLGRLRTDGDAPGWYRRRLGQALEGRRLEGLRVALDCGHGAATVTAAEVLAAAGADVVAVLGNAPDGTNINAGCGSTDPTGLAAAVLAHRADAGLAFDGDADRVIAVDGSGQVVDGDRLLALFATDLAARDRLRERTVVVTVMTNLGFHLAMTTAGIAVHQTPVGDRYVLEALDRHGWSLGGEQSGHLIFRQLASTGDGVLSGLLLLDVMVRSGRALADLAGSSMERLPQVLRNVAVADRNGLDGAAGVWADVKGVEAELGGQGRVLLRPSGTERLIRIMVEAPTEASAAAAADRLERSVLAALGGQPPVS